MRPTSSGDAVAKNSLLAAALNSGVAILLRLLTFATNAFILRYVSRETLGVINMRLILFVDTALFVSREAFRKACLSKTAHTDWTGCINLIWMSVPVGLVCSLALGHLWKYSLDWPSDPADAEQYLSAINLMIVSVVLELCCEPFFIVGQVHMFVKLRSFIDFTQLASRTAIMLLTVVYRNHRAIVLFGWAHLLSVCFCLLINMAFFAIQIHRNTKSATALLHLKSYRDFFPKQPLKFDKDLLPLVTAFWKQGLVKQLLTEGEKYVITWFHLMSLSDQGIYDVVANLGSIAARLILSKVEDSAYFYFSQTVTRDDATGGLNCNEVVYQRNLKAARHINILLRTMSLFGLLVATFGPPFSHLLLHVYGGPMLSSGIGPALLKCHCVLVLLLAVNGVSEGYAFAVMSTAQVTDHNFTLAKMSTLFLVAAYGMARFIGPLGLAVANSCHFSLRILHNFKIIQMRAAKLGKDLPSPFTMCLPSGGILISLLLSGFGCYCSESWLYNHSSPSITSIASHVAVGAVGFMFTLAVIWRKQQDIRQVVTSLLDRSKKRK